MRRLIFLLALTIVAFELFAQDVPDKQPLPEKIDEATYLIDGIVYYEHQSLFNEDKTEVIGYKNVVTGDILSVDEFEKTKRLYCWCDLCQIQWCTEYSEGLPEGCIPCIGEGCDSELMWVYGIEEGDCSDHNGLCLQCAPAPEPFPASESKDEE